MKKEVLLTTFIILTSVVMAGCTQTETTRSGEEVVLGNGMAILNFTTTQTHAEPKDELTFVLTVQNVGNLQARQVFSEVYAYGELINLTPLRQTTTSPNLDVFDKDEIVWDFQVPEDLAVYNNYYPFARVCYVYNSTAYSDVLFVGTRWNQDIPVLVKGSSRAPLKVGFETKEPYKGEKQDQSFEVTITNIENGFVANNTNKINDISVYNYGNENLITKVTLIITGLTEEFLNATGEPETRTIINFTGYDKKFNEPGIQQADFSCEIQSSDETVLEEFNQGLVEPGAQVVCTAKNVRMMVGLERSLKIFFNTNPGRSDSEVSGRIRAIIDYRYCVQSPALSITAEPD